MGIASLCSPPLKKTHPPLGSGQRSASQQGVLRIGAPGVLLHPPSPGFASPPRCVAGRRTWVGKAQLSGAHAAFQLGRRRGGGGGPLAHPQPAGAGSRQIA